MSQIPYPERDARVFFDAARDRLSVQLQTLDALDTKVAVLFSTSTALLGILAAVLALKAGSFNGWDYWAVLTSGVEYSIVAAYSWRAYRVREWHVGPDLRSIYRLYSESPDTDAQLEWAVANKFRQDYEANKPDVEKKSNALRPIGLALFIQTLTLVLTLVLVA
jgi:hypothetical protein